MMEFEVHHLKKSQVLLQEVVITADISYADFVPGMFFLDGHWASWCLVSEHP